jgi:transglutaminase-like putative cysteine protease
MRIAIEHKTSYGYAESASYGILALRLTPAPYDGLQVIDWSIKAAPGGQMLAAQDGYGNTVHLMTITEPHRELEVVASGLVDVEERHGVVRGLAEIIPLRVFLRPTPLTSADPAIARLAAAHAAGEPIARLHALMNEIRDHVDYIVGSTSALTTAGEAFAAGRGVCQDHAHIFISAARLLGIPSRYVTGYLLVDAGGPAVAHHAWAEAWVDGLGWIGFDPANRLCPTASYVRLACGLDASCAAPIRGSRRGGPHERLDVHVLVEQHGAQQ